MIGQSVLVFYPSEAARSYRWGRTEPGAGRATITIAITLVAFALLWPAVAAVYVLR